MSRFGQHAENHLVDRIGWMRAAVLGANDGIVSTASLIVGVAAAAANQNGVLIAGVAGLVAGAMAMAAGEYVSVSSQSDTERADLARERGERCLGSPRARRAWHFGNHHSASSASRIDIGRIVFRRCGHAPAHGGRIARRCACPAGIRCVFRLSRCSRCNRSTSGRRQHSTRHRPGDILGRLGDGAHRRHREIIRHGYLKIGTALEMQSKAR